MFFSESCGCCLKFHLAFNRIVLLDFLLLWLVITVDGESFSIEAQESLRQVTAGQLVQCQPTAVAENNVPYIHIIAKVGNQVSH